MGQSEAWQRERLVATVEGTLSRLSAYHTDADAAELIVQAIERLLDEAPSRGRSEDSG